MSQIITVWGNPGSGKSMFCCNLAKVLTAGKEKAIIINADSSTPMLPVWMPDRLFDASDSIGNVLSALEINTALVAERVCVGLPFHWHDGVFGRRNSLFLSGAEV